MTMWLRAARREDAAEASVSSAPRSVTPLSGRSLREVVSAGLNLMTVDIHPALFTCTRCVGVDGRYNCVAGDSIWVGYGSPAAENERFERVSEEIPVNEEAIRAAYMVRGESVWRVVKDILNPKGKAVKIYSRTLRAVEMAIGLSVPGALPEMRVRWLTTSEVAIRDVLRQISDVDKAVASTLQQMKISLFKYKTRSTSECPHCIAAAAHLSDYLAAMESPARTEASMAQATAKASPASDGASTTPVAASATAPRKGQPALSVAARTETAGATATNAASLVAGADKSAAPGAMTPLLPDLSAQPKAPGATAAHTKRAPCGGKSFSSGKAAKSKESPHLHPSVLAMSRDTWRELFSFVTAVTIDSVVLPFRRSHAEALRELSNALRSAKPADAIGKILQQAKAPKKAAATMRTVPPTAASTPETNVAPAATQTAAPKVGPAETTAAASTMAATTEAATAAPTATPTVPAVTVLRYLRFLRIGLSAARDLFGQMQALAVHSAVCLDAVAGCIVAFSKAWRNGPDATVEFEETWVAGNGDQEKLAAKFRRRYPGASSLPQRTGIFAPSLPQCRPEPFAWQEVVRTGMCSKHYAHAHKISPGAMTLCCACTNPLILAFSVLDRKEAPQVLLNMLVTRFGKMPHFLIYDFVCGAFRAALGKVAWLISDCKILSDRLHIFNHLCSDLFDPRSYTAMDGVDTESPEQRNAPIRNIHHSLRGMGVQNYTALLAYQTATLSREAQMRAKLGVKRLPDEADVSGEYFLQFSCAGCIDMAARLTDDVDDMGIQSPASADEGSVQSLRETSSSDGCYSADGSDEDVSVLVPADGSTKDGDGDAGMLRPAVGSAEDGGGDGGVLPVADGSGEGVDTDPGLPPRADRYESPCPTSHSGSSSSSGLTSTQSDLE